MTEQNIATDRPEETQPIAEMTPPQKKNRSGAAGIMLAIVAIILALVLGAGLYLWGQKQTIAQNTASAAFTAQLSALQKQQDKQTVELQEKLKQQTAVLEASNNQQSVLARQLADLQQKLNTISGSSAKTWLLAQADFLIKMAGRKLWSDRDIATAVALLKSADTSLADMNDPSLLTVRQALTQDIGALSASTQVDYDGIILKLNQLANQADNLRLADNDSDGSPMDADNNELSGTISDWRQNLTKSWQSFRDSFITIRRRDAAATPLLAPNQDVYLRENIRSRLLIAAQAVPRHQNEIYKQSLENVSTWVRAYYDANDASTKAFLDEIESLSQQNIDMDVPQTLQSQPLLEKLIQSRANSVPPPPAAVPQPTPVISGENNNG